VYCIHVAMCLLWNAKTEDGSNWVAEICRSNLNNNKLINEKLICAFRWSVLPSIMKMHGPKNKIRSTRYTELHKKTAYLS